MLCVFLALIKRRADVSRTDRQAAITARPASELYTVERLEHMLAVSAGSAVVTYALYCLASPHSPGVHMVWTVPLVLYIIFRLYSLAIASPNASPVELVLHDAATWVVALIWIALIVAIMQWSDLPELRGWITQ